MFCIDHGIPISLFTDNHKECQNFIKLVLMPVVLYNFYRYALPITRNNCIVTALFKNELKSDRHICHHSPGPCSKSNGDLGSDSLSSILFSAGNRLIVGLKTMLVIATKNNTAQTTPNPPNTSP